MPQCILGDGEQLGRIGSIFPRWGGKRRYPLSHLAAPSRVFLILKFGFMENKYHKDHLLGHAFNQLSPAEKKKIT